jgi:phospho-N-acetylmuramoyl-pentapeptide-transferase
VFQYLTLRAVMAALTSLIGLIAGPFVIRRLVWLKVSQSVNMRCKRT